jgi:hypothetical protein
VETFINNKVGYSRDGLFGKKPIPKQCTLYEETSVKDDLLNESKLKLYPTYQFTYNIDNGNNRT